MKVVIDCAYGMGEFSESFYEHYDIQPGSFVSRYDTRLIEYIEKYGWERASGQYSRLMLIEIPDGVAYRIADYDGAEYIEFRDEIEWSIADNGRNMAYL